MKMRSSMGFEGKRPTGRAPKHQCVLSRPWGLAEAMESFHRPVILGMLQVDKKKKQEVMPGITKDTSALTGVFSSPGSAMHAC